MMLYTVLQIYKLNNIIQSFINREKAHNQIENGIKLIFGVLYLIGNTCKRCLSYYQAIFDFIS